MNKEANVKIHRGLTGAAASAVVALLLTVASASSEAHPAEAAPIDASSDVIVIFEDEAVLEGSTFSTIIGDRLNDGTCVFSPPPLELKPGETAVHERQVQVNLTRCSTVVERGVPIEPTRFPTDGSEVAEVAVEQTTSGTAPGNEANATTSSGYYRVWWEDVVNIHVHRTTSNIAWTWNGTCVTSSSGSGHYWWASGTGWTKYDSGSSISRTCARTHVEVDATYRNGAFCWPGVVWTYLTNVTATGYASGLLTGHVDNTYSTYPAACPTLHYHRELIRVSG